VSERLSGVRYNASPPDMSTLASWIFFVVLTIGVASCTIYFFRYRGYENWPKVKGTVEALVKIKCIRTDTRGPFYAVISYSYQVESEYYSGEWDSPTFRLEKEALEFAETYMPKGSNVQVLHHPTHPERSTLQVDPRLGQPDYLTELKL